MPQSARMDILKGLLSPMEQGPPLVLLPIRIETRFQNVGNALQELAIRIFPDDVHIDSHEPELALVESQWGQHFWTQFWLALDDTALQAGAWEQLVRRFGGPRAAWIGRSLEPTNQSDRPTQLTGTGGLPIQPIFPTVEQRAARWTRAARAALMPDRWVAWGWRDNQLVLEVVSGPVQSDLAVGPDPNELGTPTNGIPLDDGIKWMADLDQAVAAGMAMRGPFQGDARLERLIVFGIRAGDSTTLSNELESHLIALRHSSGLDFAPQGVATNSTDTTHSGWSTGEDNETSFESMQRWLAPLAAGSSLDNADVLSRALYQSREALGRCRHAEDDEQLDAKMMNQLLWPVTGGYYLHDVMGLSPTLVNEARDHVLGFVRGRGPYPALRVGNQPYGVYPILVGTVSDPRPNHFMDRVTVIVQSARETWDTSSTTVPRLNVASTDADADLVEALATVPNPVRFSVRLAVERSVLEDFANTVLPGSGWQGAAFNFQEPRQWLDDVVGLNTSSAPVHDTVYSAGAKEWVTGLATNTGLSDFDALENNYLTWLATNTIADIDNEVGTSSLEDDTLLYMLARRSVLLWDSSPLRGTENPNAVRNAATYLANRPTSVLDQTLRETMGLFGYRLDAWEASLVARQLATSRDEFDTDPAATGGVSIGCYGWLEDLVSKDQKPPFPDLGFIHAPSPQHAVTAALLRNAWLSHGGTADTPFAVNITSDRARRALELLDGVRNGFSLGELLGYHFERQLHEGYPGVFLDKHINAFRDIAPLVANKQPGTESELTGAVNLAAGANVVDGLRLMVMRRDVDPVLTAVLDNIGDLSEKEKIGIELDALLGIVDSVADVSMAEGVHQLAQGNLARSAAITDAVSSGSVSPPEIDVVSPPRSGLGFTYRLMMPLSDTNAAGSTWSGGLTSPRALVEPQLERWASEILPDPNSVLANVTFAGEAGPVAQLLRLSDLALCALDAVILAPAEGGLSGEFRQRVDWAILRNLPATVTEGTPYTVNANYSGVAGEISFADFALLARNVRDLLASSRTLHGGDFSPPTDGAGRQMDLAELEARSHLWAGELRNAKVALDVVDLNGDLELVRTAFISLSQLGMANAFPKSAVGSTDADRGILNRQHGTLVARVVAVLNELGEDAEVAATVAQASPVAVEKLLVKRLKAIFGRGLPIMPRFTVVDPVGLTNGFASSTSLQGGNPNASVGWLHQVAQVNDNVRRLLGVTQLSEALSDTSKLALEVSQFPTKPGELWVGIPFDPSHPPDGGRVSLVSLAVGSVQWDVPVHGLMIDEWSESVPRARQTTGVAFHYDAPVARAPQSLLMLGLLDTETSWTLDLIRASLVQAFDAPKRRLTDATSLEAGGHFLPAVYLATAAVDESVAEDVARGLVADENATSVEPETPPLGGP